MAAETAKDLRSAGMKELFARVQEQQRRLNFTDAKLCEFATTTLAAADPYHRFKATSLDFLGRLKTGPMKTLLRALEKTSA